MSNERKPLLTEEQIQEMLKRANKNMTINSGTTVDYWLAQWLRYYSPATKGELSTNNMYPYQVGMDLFLAFLRGKTKRVLNLDRLRKDVNAWVADPNRKYPEWMTDTERHGHHWILSLENLSRDILCQESSIIGINPDGYFEEVEVTE